MRYVIAVTGCLAGSTIAAAQLPARDTTAIPRDLAAALITYTYGVYDPTFVIGRLPNPGIAPLIPPGARILGGMTRGGRRGGGENSTTILEVRETPDSILNVIEVTLERLGWRRPPMTMGRGRGEGGFVSRETMVGPRHAMSFAFCSDSSYITVSATPAGQLSFVRLVTSSDAPMMCDERRGRMMPQAVVELPTLVPPPGASTVGGHGSGGSDDSAESAVELSSRLSAADMVAHFAMQLEQQGWTLGARAATTPP